MLLTPTYHVYKMYVPFQDAQSIPIERNAGNHKFGDATVSRIDAIAAPDKGGKVWVALTNMDPNSPLIPARILQGHR
jgi:alpha-N-arabinofuranosidase